MLSIIVSSYQPEYFNQFSSNVKDTIGEDFLYEIIQIWNPGLMGICEAYNKGAAQAKYENLLFVHEDVIFETKNWGKILLESLNLDDLGVLGIAGSNYYGYVPSGCWNPIYVVNIIQMYEEKYVLYDKVNFNNSVEKVKVIDGVFLACKKTIFEEFKFNQSINNFHGYDLIFTLEISKKYQNYVTSQILLKHNSFGKIEKNWIDSVIKVRDLVGFEKTNKYNKDVEMKNYYKLIHLLDLYEPNYFKKVYTILRYCNINVLGLINVFKILYRLRYLKLRNNI